MASLAARRERDMERARAAAARRVQQAAEAQQRTQDRILGRAAQSGWQQQQQQFDPDAQVAPPGWERPEPAASHIAAAAAAAAAPARSRPVSAIRREAPARPPWDVGASSAAAAAVASAAPTESMDISRAIASRHQLQDGFAAEHGSRFGQLSARPRSASASSFMPVAAAASAHVRSPSARVSFSGRSSYDWQGVLRARQMERDRIVAAEFAAQEREEQAAHRASMERAAAALQPFEITPDWRRRWAHTTHTNQCGICLDPFRLRALVVQLPCAHTFHARECLQPWLDRQAVCPTCRFDVRQNRPAPAEEESQRDSDAV